MTAPLRVLVVLDGVVVPAAVARAVDRVAGAPVDLVGVRVGLEPAAHGPAGAGATLVDRVERAVFRPRPDATGPVDLRERGLPLLTGDGPTGPVDVLLDLTSGGAGDAGRTPARLGVWSLRFGDEGHRWGAGSFVPEYLAGSDAGVCELVVEDGEGPLRGPRVVYRSVSAVDRLSPARTRNAAAWKSAEIPARVLADVAARGPAALTVPPATHVTTTPGPVGSRPHRGTSLRVAVTVAGRSVREAVRRVGGRPAWFVAVRTGRTPRPGDPEFGTAGFRPLAAPPGRFYADPFVVARPDGGAHVFVEDGPLVGGPARLSVLSLGADAEPDAPARVVLAGPTHLSYPHVFADGGDRYLLPETADSGSVRLYRARRYPWDWEDCGELLPGVRAWDPTLLHHHATYWLFVTLAPPGVRPSDELFLFSADTLLGPWRPHPANPVVSDARRARPAGRVLQRPGCLLRPAQDGSGAYGRRVVLNRIDVLTQDAYAETPVGSIEPGWLPGVERTHTYTTDGTFEVVDGLRYERRYGRPRAR